MLSSRVIKHADVFGEVGAGLITSRVDPSLGTLALPELEEALRDWVVVAVAVSAHVAGNTMLFQEYLPSVSSEWGALLGVVK